MTREWRFYLASIIIPTFLLAMLWLLWVDGQQHIDYYRSGVDFFVYGLFNSKKLTFFGVLPFTAISIICAVWFLFSLTSCLYNIFRGVVVVNKLKKFVKGITNKEKSGEL